jgi:hypothetical protein
MTYSTATDIKILIDTALDDTIILQVIAEADSRIDDELTREGLSVSSPVPSLIKRASKYIASALILERDWISGATPDDFRIGDFAQKIKIENQIEKLEQRGLNSLKEYIRRQKFSDYFKPFTIVENKTDIN